MSVRDGNWEVDLIWKYFHETAAPVKTTGQWYKKMDPAGKLDDRRRVYDMLVGEAEHTDPSLDQLRQSMIPWNQRHQGIIDAFKSELACGSVVKLAFWKYMGWGSGTPPRRSVKQRSWNAVAWIVKSLQAGQPIRAYLKTKNHYIGIVGFRRKRVMEEAVGSTRFFTVLEFLCIDPWAGGASTGAQTITYAGAKTKFLGIATQEGDKLMYDGHQIMDVEGYHPF